MEWSERIGRRIKLRDLHILLAVAQAGSIAKAAQGLAISQPVVSKVIADLEGTLGVRLLDRDRHGAKPTAYGHALLNRGVAAFDELRQGVKEIEFLADPTVGEIRIGATEPMVAGFLPAVIDRLARQRPRIAFQVAQFTTVTQFHELRERNVDLIIGRLPKASAEDDLETEILFDEPQFVVAGVRNRWVRRDKIKLAELVNEPWTLPPADTVPGALVANAFRSCGLEVPRINVSANSIQMHNALLATGRYLAMFPGSLLLFSAKRLSVKVLPVQLPVCSTPVGIVTLKRRTITPVVHLFVECVRELAKPLALRAPAPASQRAPPPAG